MRFFTSLTLLIASALALALFSCADPNVREPHPQSIVPGDSVR